MTGHFRIQNMTCLSSVNFSNVFLSLNDLKVKMAALPSLLGTFPRDTENAPQFLGL